LEEPVAYTFGVGDRYGTWMSYLEKEKLLDQGKKKDWLFSHKKLTMTKISNFQIVILPPMMKYILLSSKFGL
jgi:hypothetical protein